MRILVIDDTSIHQMSARQTLVGHELTVVGTYDEAYELLEEPAAPWQTVSDELDRRGFKDPYAKETTDVERADRLMERIKLEKELCPPPSFDVVLCDLLMPAGKTQMGPKGMKYVGQEMPVGFALSLMAAIHGAKYVAVVTDTNHHDHPAAAMLDPFLSRCPHKDSTESGPPRFVTNGAIIGYYQSPLTPVDGTACEDCNGTGNKNECSCKARNGGSPKPDCDSCNGAGHGCWKCRNTGKQWGKDWGMVLFHLIAKTG